MPRPMPAPRPSRPLPSQPPCMATLFGLPPSQLRPALQPLNLRVCCQVQCFSDSDHNERDLGYMSGETPSAQVVRGGCAGLRQGTAPVLPSLNVTLAWPYGPIYPPSPASCLGALRDPALGAIVERVAGDCRTL